MLRRVYLFSLSTLLVAIAGFTFAPTAALGQLALVAPEVRVSVGEVQALLDRGRQIETESRWGDAMSFYEDALRRFPGDRLLDERYQTSRLHFELVRRYRDARFVASVAEMPPQQASQLYAEVLLKIQSHYVENPDWRALFEAGTDSVLVALDDPLFAESNLPRTEPARISRFRRELPERLAASPVESRHAAQQLAEWVASQAHEHLGLAETATLLEFSTGTVNALDPYSAYLTEGQLDDVYSQIEGNFVGLGVELKADAGELLIVGVIPGSPADQGGLRAGDRITEVDGHKTSDYATDEAANLLRGPEGSSVEVVVSTPGIAPRRVRVRRATVEVPSVEKAHLIDPAAGVAYLKLTSFQKTTSTELDAALWQLHRQGMRSLVMDLRGNPGGLLTTSVDVVDKFVDRGVIVSTRGRSLHEDYSYSAHEAGTWRMPLVVLIDHDSASAAEIFAGAIRDHGRGRIVGTQSYGKGSVQGIFPLNLGGAGVRLTTAKFFSPKGLPFSRVGVSPDVQVQQTLRPFGDGTIATVTEPATDAALEQAVNVARGRTASR